jgi:hypothetical protein
MKPHVLMMGVVGGLAIGGAAVAIHESFRPAPPTRAPAFALAEEVGRIRRLVIQYHPDAGEIVGPIYRRFLRAVGDEVEVTFVARDRGALDDLRQRLGADWPPRWRVLEAEVPISTWAKDRSVVLERRGGATVLLAPDRHWRPSHLRTNDQEVPWRLARQWPGLFEVRDSGLVFDGGDMLVTADRVLAHPVLIEKNAGRFDSPASLRQRLEALTGKPVAWVTERPADAPDHHVGMFLTILGQTALVGASGSAEMDATFAGRLDAVAARMQALGYQVKRVPLIGTTRTRAWISYNNGVIETRGRETVFYMPTFGRPDLDAEARSVFESVGCRVIGIDCSGAWRLGGTLRCLVSVVGRD